jgi:hypothetical protein
MHLRARAVVEPNRRALSSCEHGAAATASTVFDMIVWVFAGVSIVV